MIANTSKPELGFYPKRWEDREIPAPVELIDERDHQGMLMAQNGARASGTPFISFFTPDEMLQLARGAGFKDVRHVSGAALNDRYLSGRSDGLRVSTGEDFLVATP